MLDDHIRPAVLTLSFSTYFRRNEVSTFAFASSRSISLCLALPGSFPRSVVEFVLCCVPTPQVHTNALNFNSIPWWLMN